MHLLSLPAARLVAWMRPGDHRMAARTVSVLCGVGVVVTAVTLPLMPAPEHPADRTVSILAVVAVIFVAAMSAAAWFFDEASTVAWLVCPPAAVAVLTFVDLATSDASVSGQIFFVFPAVYGAALLPRGGAVVMAVLSLAGEIIVVFAALPGREALVDACYVASALATISVMLVRGVERQAALVAELARLAAVDPLTGLVTRRAFDEAMLTALGSPVGDEGTSLLLLDVDRFKRVNDRFGHPGGDQVLIQLSDLLVGASRRGDVVCRLGGDEIAVLLPRCTYEVGERRAEEIVSMVRAHGFAIDVGDLIKVSVSAGLAHAPTHGSDARSLYAAADAALYDAKRGGRDRFVAYPQLVA